MTTRTCATCKHFHPDVSGLHGYCSQQAAVFPAAAPACWTGYEPRSDNHPRLKESQPCDDS